MQNFLYSLVNCLQRKYVLVHMLSDKADANLIEKIIKSIPISRTSTLWHKFAKSRTFFMSYIHYQEEVYARPGHIDLDIFR